MIYQLNYICLPLAAIFADVHNCSCSNASQVSSVAQNGIFIQKIYIYI